MRKTARRALIGAAAIAVAGLGAIAVSQLPPATGRYMSPGPIPPLNVEHTETQWPLFGGNGGGSQYSGLDQINRKNVRGLKVAWTHKSGDIIDDPVNKARSTVYEVTPIHANNHLYYCTPLNRVFALDPATGKERWVFDAHAVDPATGRPLVKDERRAGICRGVTYWESGAPHAGAQCEKRVFRADTKGHVFALDADTGKPCRDFGSGKGHPGYVSNWDYPVHGNDPMRGTTAPPSVIGDVLVTSSNANDSVTNANDGVIRGWDARSGKLLWEFNPIPEPYRDVTGAANAWGGITVDEKLGLIYVPTTSPSPDFFGGTRRFDMPLVSALVALDAGTGEVRWSFQTVHHDLFDYDNGAHPLLVTITKDGRKRDVAILPTKMGFIYVFDRATGESLWPIREVPVPASSMPGDKASPTQPAPQGIATFAHQTMNRDSAWGVTPLDRWICRSRYDGYRHDGMFTPPSLQGSVALPSVFGGGNWGGAAYDPQSNQLIVKAQNISMILKLTKLGEADTAGANGFSSRELKGTPYWFSGSPFLSPLGIPCNAPPWGTLTAIDMGTGQITWQKPLGQSRRFGLLVPETFGWGAANVAGPLITKGGLVFIGATMDGMFRALDVRNGEELWRSRLPAPGVAVPMSYHADGRQYVVIAAGGAARLYPELNDAIVAYTLQ